ncbi:MAG TPA: ECF transporter S component [Clostridia bacterium]|nr:ECF transporter S component [Clostridia bacterium]HOL60598.1 ECF transporter S component [Clostridia bacterium]HPO53005.1 ECF transporter S component [Clostridia bacterium]
MYKESRREKKSGKGGSVLTKIRSIKAIDIAKTGIFASLIFLSTAFLKVPIALGYIHAGDIVIFVSCYFLKPRYAAISAGIGSMFADLLAGYVIYMPVTLVVKALMALIAGVIVYKKTDVYRLVTGYIFAGLFMVGGYLVFEGFYYGWAPAIANVPFALIQPAVAIAAAVPMVLLFSRIRGIEKYR